MANFNLELEKAFIASLLQYPDGWAEISAYINPADFSMVHKSVFAIIKQQLDAIPRGSVDPVVISEKMTALGIKIEGVENIDYLSALAFTFQVKDKESCVEIAKELKKITVRRELIDKCERAKKELEQSGDKPIDEIVGIVDRALADVGKMYQVSDTEDLFGGMIDSVEYLGENPLDVEKMGYMGPFESINRTIGSTCYPGGCTVIAARSKGGKSTFSFFYSAYLALTYGLPILHLDVAEMTKQDLQMRAVCCLSEGRIPLWAVESGEWRKNKEWTDIIRGEIWPKVQKMKMYYKNVGSMDPKELVSYIKRFYYKEVGRGNHLVINWDYIKGLESIGNKTQEYQAIGYMVNRMKCLITEEITASIIAGVQMNRSGIVGNKDSSSIDDSENSISLSDRIIQMSTNTFALRYKTSDEMAAEGGKFGNVILKPLAERKLLGKYYEEIIQPVKMPDGRMMKNYFNLQCSNFAYKDCGSLLDMMKAQGFAKTPIPKKKDKNIF